MRLGRGQILYGPTQESRSTFMVLKGGLRLYKMLGAAELTLEIVEAGHLFGDVPALAGRVRRGPRSLARGHPPASPSIEIVTECLPMGRSTARRTCQPATRPRSGIDGRISRSGQSCAV